MKHRDQLVEELAGQLREELPMYFVDGFRPDDRIVADWILNHYRPPLEWEETPPVNDPSAPPREQFSWRYRLRTVIAGQLVEYSGFLTAESKARAPFTEKGFRRHIRYQVGKGIVNFLDGIPQEER